jgi:hypothetical protein
LQDKKSLPATVDLLCKHPASAKPGISSSTLIFFGAGFLGGAGAERK